MAVSREEARLIAEDVVRACRSEIDHEIRKLHDHDIENAWTEERAKQIAEEAASIAVTRITQNFYMSVGKKFIATVGVTVVALVYYLKDEVTRWIGSR